MSSTALFTITYSLNVSQQIRNELLHHAVDHTWHSEAVDHTWHSEATLVGQAACSF